MTTNEAMSVLKGVIDKRVLRLQNENNEHEKTSANRDALLLQSKNREEIEHLRGMKDFICAFMKNEGIPY